jgi:hypothetical protein
LLLSFSSLVKRRPRFSLHLSFAAACALYTSNLAFRVLSFLVATAVYTS